MNYIEVVFKCEPNEEFVKDILSALLVEVDYESFVVEQDGLRAYVPTALFDEQALITILKDFPLNSDIRYEYVEIVGKDWNEEWEKNYFKPLVIDNKCIIQSTFHNEPTVYDYNIIIDPKMAFGTGHHQTTELMIREILKTDFVGKNVLDRGCGTAILGMLASMRGAESVLAIDIDNWACTNAIENIQLNNITNVEVKIGGADLLSSHSVFDIIFANINRNILLQDIKAYAQALHSGGSLLMSGFYVEDIPTITDECSKCGLQYRSQSQKDKWVAVRYSK